MQRIEQGIQKGIVEYLRYSGYLYCVPDCGINVSSVRTRGILKSMGRVSGVPDILVFVPGKVIGLEVKRPAIKGICSKGRISETQIEFGERMKCLGHEYHIVYSVQEVEDILKKNKKEY